LRSAESWLQGEQIGVRRTYKKELKQLMKDQYNGHHPKRRRKATKARKRIKTIAHTLVRELRRKIDHDQYEEQLSLFKKGLDQKRNDKNKIYSLHELEVYCIAKGKAHKKYEFGNKVSVVKGLKTGVITSVKLYTGNPHDSITRSASLEQSQRVREKAGGNRPQIAIADRGYRGVKQVKETQIVIPDSGRGKSKYEKEKARNKFRKRAGIEPIIGHLKQVHRMQRNYLKGLTGDISNTLLAAIGFKLKKMLNLIRSDHALFRQKLYQYLFFEILASLCKSAFLRDDYLL
jgi:IS5 family transposase